MTGTVLKILEEIEQLPELERRELASEVLRRMALLDAPPLTDDELVAEAEAVFLALDRAEAADDPTASR